MANRRTRAAALAAAAAAFCVLLPLRGAAALGCTPKDYLGYPAKSSTGSTKNSLLAMNPSVTKGAKTARDYINQHKWSQFCNPPVMNNWLQYSDALRTAMWVAQVGQPSDCCHLCYMDPACVWWQVFDNNQPACGYDQHYVCSLLSKRNGGTPASPGATLVWKGNDRPTTDPCAGLANKSCPDKDPRHWCSGGAMRRCPVDTACKQGSGCVPDAPNPCAGKADNACPDAGNVCKKQAAVSCPPDSACQADKGCVAGTPTTCAVGDPDHCTGDDTVCRGATGRIEACLAGQLCVGAPTNDCRPCASGDKKCIDDVNICVDGSIYQCTNGGVCRADACAQPVGGGSDGACFLPDGACLDEHHFCLAGVSHACPASSAGCGTGDPSSPCKAGLEGTTKSCNLPDYRCVDRYNFCQAHIVMHCAEGTICSDKHPPGQSPCVNPPMVGGALPPHTDLPACRAPDWACLGNRAYCYDSEIHKCPAGMVCKGGGPCTWPGPCYYKRDGACLGRDAYCHRGDVVQCRRGTRCYRHGPCTRHRYE